VNRAPEVHADGEIWVEALWEIRANLIKQFGDPEGRKRLRHLVIDGMKLAIPAGSMVDHRAGRNREFHAIDNEVPQSLASFRIAELLDEVRADLPQSFHPDLAVRMNLRRAVY